MNIFLPPPNVANQPFNVHIHQQTIQTNNGKIKTPQVTQINNLVLHY